MTKVGARQAIDELSMRVFEIEKQQLREKIHELEWLEDDDQIEFTGK